LQVSLAKGEGERLGLSGYTSDKKVCKLFFGMLPYSYGEREIRSLLCPSILASTEVEEVHIIRKNGGTSDPTGSAFVRIVGENNAKVVIEALSDKITLPGAPNLLNISFATVRNNNRSSSSSSMGRNNARPVQVLGVKRPRDDSAPQTMGIMQLGLTADKKVCKLFFGMLPYSYGEREIRSLLCPSILASTDVEEVYIHRKNGGTGDPTGSAFVRIVGETNAKAVIDALSYKITLPGAPNLLKISFAAVKNNNRSSSSSSMGRNNVRPVEVIGMKRPRDDSAPQTMGNMPQQQQQQYNQQQQYPPQQQYQAQPPPQQRMRMQGSNSSSSSPTAPTFYKLHVANLAFHVAESDVSTLFGQFGRIIEVYILRDRASGRSKGAAFIKFANHQDAENAIGQINGTLQWGFERPLRVSFALGKNGMRPQHAPMSTRQLYNRQPPFHQQQYQQQYQQHPRQFYQYPPQQQQQQQPQQFEAAPQGLPPRAASSNPYSQWNGQAPLQAPPSLPNYNNSSSGGSGSGNNFFQ
jgi:heterogeneous nuclear ribonucleoprotein A1/A3